MKRHWIAIAAPALFATACSDGSGGGRRLSPDEVEELCVRMVSCNHEMHAGSTATVSACIDGMMWQGVAATYGYNDAIDCMVAAGSDCDALFQCSNEGHAAASCDAATYAEHCEGSMRVGCSEGTISYFDCHGLDVIYGDATCRLDPGDGSVDCATTRTCGAGLTTTCDGNALELCTDGDFMRVDCGLVGASCRLYTAGIFYCIGTGGGCSGEEAWCDGTSVVRCLGGREGIFDCAARLGADFTCAVDSTSGDSDCAPASTTCVGETNADTCTGTTIEYCRWGRDDTADCAALGFARCVQVGNAAFCE